MEEMPVSVLKGRIMLKEQERSMNMSTADTAKVMILSATVSSVGE